MDVFFVDEELESLVDEELESFVDEELESFVDEELESFVDEELESFADVVGGAGLMGRSGLAPALVEGGFGRS